jgi:putative ABC transport system permease protein
MLSFRYAIRAIVRRPAFAVVAIATLALGIGANAAIFSVFDAVLLRPLPYPDAARIVMAWEYSAEVHQRLGFDRLPSSVADFTDYRRRNTSFESIASMRTEQMNLTGEGDPERIGAVRVSSRFFDVLGVQPMIGRTFRADDETRGRMVLIASSLWRDRFGSDANISGRVILLNGEPATIVGVLPAWFDFPAAGELPEGFGFTLTPVVWALEVFTPVQEHNRGGKSLAIVGRLKQGVTLAQAQADLAAIAGDIARESPATNSGWTIRVLSLRDQLVGGVRPALVALLTAVGFVLLIACANVANLLLVRAASRQREICVRYALGASASSLVLAFLMETVILSIVAGLAGLGIATWMLRVLLSMVPETVPAIHHAGLDWRVFAFTTTVSLVIGTVFGAVPAWYSTRYDTAEGLREGGRGSVGGPRATRTRNALVVAEVALAVVLLIGSVLLIQTFVRLTHVETGFRTDRILTMEVTLPKSRYSPERTAAFFQSVIAGMSALPGVEGVGSTSSVPLSARESLVPVTIEGNPAPQPGRELIAEYRVVTPGYFRVFGISLRAGDSLPETLPASRQPGVIISETLARLGWPNGNPLGHRVKLGSYWQEAPWYTVVGIVADTRNASLDTSFRPQVYVHHQSDAKEQMAIVLRTSGDPGLLAAPARGVVQSIDPNQPVARVRTMDEIMATAIATRRFHMFLVGMFAALAVTLAVVGLYAVVSFSVGERVHEMGLRLALGAQPANLLALVLREGLVLVASGAALGIVVALVLTRFLETLLFGVHARDLPTFVIAPSVLFVAGVLGCLAPARRAMRTDPAIALRSE